jgi:hypothetical protein
LINKGENMRRLQVVLILITIALLPARGEDMQKYLRDTQALARDGEHEEALERYLWFHDHALEHSRSMVGVRLSLALSYWKKLGDVYPPALAAMKKTRDDKTALFAQKKGSRSLFQDVMALNRTLKEDKKTIELFRKLDQDQNNLAKQCWIGAKRVVIKAKAYDLAKKYIGNPMEEFSKVKKMYDSMNAMSKKKDFGKGMRASNDRGFVTETLLLIDLAVGIDNVKVAKEIQAEALKILDDPRLRNAVLKKKEEQKITNSPNKILFVGNSFTYMHNGVESHVKKLAASAIPPKLIQADSKTKGGATLKIQYGRPVVHEIIREGDYDVVILQEDIPELTEHSVEPFFEHARLFDKEIRNTGAKTMFFMTWPYERLNWITLEEIAAAHRNISMELNASVAPVGNAFHLAQAERPGLDMLVGDKEHESIHGTYLAASVIYASLFRESPQGLTYTPTGVSIEEAAFLQRIAWKTVQEPLWAPTLLSPASGAVLDNGRSDRQDDIVWDFDWTDIASAERYHLYVKGRTAANPVINKEDISGSSYHHIRRGSYIIERFRYKRSWKVRAYVEGEWTDWSSVRYFDVEALNTDPANE